MKSIIFVCLLVAVANATDRKNRNIVEGKVNQAAPKTCGLACTAGGSWIMDLENEQYRLIYDKPSATMVGVDFVREQAIVVTNNVKGYALVNLENGWQLYGSTSSMNAVIMSRPMLNPEFMLSDNATLRTAAVQAIGDAVRVAVPQIPQQKPVVYQYQNYMDMEYFINALQAADTMEYLRENNPNGQRLKMRTYQGVLNNTDDIFTAVRSVRPATGTILDLPRAFYNRLPPVFAYGLSQLFVTLTGTPAGFIDSTQLQISVFSLLQMIPGADEIEFIETSADRTLTVYLRNGEIYYITSTGLVYDDNGNMVDTVDTTQTGTVIGLPLYDKTELNTTFPNTNNNNNNNNMGIFQPFQSFLNLFGGAFNMNANV